jgi:hypothetical protein
MVLNLSANARAAPFFGKREEVGKPVHAQFFEAAHSEMT